ncbi:MAG: ABC transporter ATP-binding protein [Candidatus Omnitrophica bacterium]|nr:ABC transporter ATP-binding protein [Candidatus Omnitrophota bacterium]MCM8826033.1 ABC transporter ATP-binding protein [Candidatus Omnitrophota bacterium]
MNELVKVVSVTKIYSNSEDKVYALRDVSLSIFENDYLAILGPSGAGKSTLLHIIGGLDNPTEGEVLFRGNSIYRMNDKDLSIWRNLNVGFVFQFYHLIEELNVMENISLAYWVNKRDDRKISLKNVEELLKYLDIGGRSKFFPSQLSGGEKQKVAIARALINEPQLILCDEPTGNLDRDSQKKVIVLLQKLNREKNKTIVLVTHNWELAKQAKRVIFIKEGQLIDIKSLDN